ncbi:GntR family transcriptional regulator [Streptomyces phaeochromogenes]|uniref:GntR family transcriptional regulator n=1 Tax=Streptomyces phaeochromogenes TaxID=1923 RepID=UPI0036C15BBA
MTWMAGYQCGARPYVCPYVCARSVPDAADGPGPGPNRRCAMPYGAGDRRAGTRLPATRRLAAELRISRGAAESAYDQLIAEGWPTARQGSGTQVAPLPPRRRTAGRFRMARRRSRPHARVHRPCGGRRTAGPPPHRWSGGQYR